jgi:hypothetical protein
MLDMLVLARFCSSQETRVAFVGGIASLSCSQLMAANSVAPVVRASEIQIVGPTSKEQITLKVAAQGPSINQALPSLKTQRLKQSSLL